MQFFISFPSPSSVFFVYFHIYSLLISSSFYTVEWASLLPIFAFLTADNFTSVYHSPLSIIFVHFLTHPLPLPSFYNIAWATQFLVLCMNCLLKFTFFYNGQFLLLPLVVIHFICLISSYILFSYLFRLAVFHKLFDFQVYALTIFQTIHSFITDNFSSVPRHLNFFFF